MDGRKITLTKEEKILLKKFEDIIPNIPKEQLPRIEGIAEGIELMSRKVG